MGVSLKVLHISAECYPAAKAGGLADVVGALPKYQSSLGTSASVVIPKYDLPWILDQNWEEVFVGAVWMGYYDQPFRILRAVEDPLGFPFYTVELLGKFDRPGIYTDPSGHYYGDEVERFTSFQKAVLKWLQRPDTYSPDILHCHDHHTGMVPFVVKHCAEYQSLAHLPTVFTIHNGRYHGAFGWNMRYLLPDFADYLGGLVEWNGMINPLAAGIRSAWAVTTVSQSYLEELKTDSNGLEWLLHSEHAKTRGILNGIDTEEWNPKTDHRIHVNLKKSIPYYKRSNKKPIIDTFGLDKDLPLITFIGRLALEKGADVLPDLVYRLFTQNYPVNFLALGSGDTSIQNALNGMVHQFQGRYNTYIGYNEDLAHQLYAASDFLLMPSRVEPCGLNQMYAMRYGTLPIVRRTGGLRDSVIDIGDPGGSGILFNHTWVGDILHAVGRALSLYDRKSDFNSIQNHIMRLDFSWQRSAGEYQKIYDSLLK